MTFDLSSDPFIGVFVFYAFGPALLAILLAVKPLRRALKGVLFATIALPLILSAATISLVLLLLLTSDVLLRYQSIKTLLFGSEFSRFEEVFRSIPLSNLEAQFGPFNYFSLINNSCLLDYYTEQEWGNIPNMLLGGLHKVACYSEWKTRGTDIETTENSLRNLLNENLYSNRIDLGIDDLSDFTLLELPKLVTVDTNNACMARSVYNVEIDLNGVSTKISITDHYNFEEIIPTDSITFWNSKSLSGYSCHNHCFTRHLSMDLSNITTPLRYSEFAEKHFSDDTSELNSSTDKDINRADELFNSSLNMQTEELLASTEFQNWLYSRSEWTDEMLRGELIQAEQKFEEISAGTSRRWIERTWEHPYLFDGYDLRMMFRPEWERSLSTNASENSRSNLFLRDDEIYYLTTNKNFMDDVVENCSKSLAESQKLAEFDGLEEPLLISLTADGSIYIAANEVPRRNLHETLIAISAEHNSDTVFIRADALLSPNAIQEVINTLSAAGFSDIRIVAEFN